MLSPRWKAVSSVTCFRKKCCPQQCYSPLLFIPDNLRAVRPILHPLRGHKEELWRMRGHRHLGVKEAFISTQIPHFLQEGEGAAEEAKKSKHILKKLEHHRRYHKLDPHIEEQFGGGGRPMACISSRPGQCSRADGYILECMELEFYMKKILRKKGKASAGVA